MKQLFAVSLSTAGICAFLSATLVVAQEAITGAPKGQVPITAEQQKTLSQVPGDSSVYGPFGGVSAIIAVVFGPTTRSAHKTYPKARCRVIRDFNDSQARPTTVCGP